jgi:hypothetical protein
MVHVKDSAILEADKYVVEQEREEARK